MMTEMKKTESKRYCLRIIAFIGIFLILFTAMMWLFSCHPDQYTYQLIGGFYEEPENSLDGVYIGSSNCFSFWNPLVAWNNYGLNIYPYASGSQPFYATEYIIREARKTQPDALYIANLNNVEADDLSVSGIHYLVNYMPETEIKKELIQYLGGLIGYSPIDNLEFRFPWIRNREHWTKYLKNGFFPELNGVKGAAKHDEYLKVCTNITDHYILSDATADIPDELIESIDSLLDYCDAENVNILFVSVPRAELSLNALARINTVADLIRARGYEVLYLTDKAEEVGLDLSQDYADNRHANVHGSIKFTNYLSEYLLENYDLKNKHGNASYSSWDDAWKIYIDDLAANILNVELDASHRDYSLAAPQDLTAEADEKGIMIQWNPVEGADGYCVYRKIGSSGAWSFVSDVQMQTSWLDDDCYSGIRYYYTVVPVRNIDGDHFFGNFPYRGIGVSR